MNTTRQVLVVDLARRTHNVMEEEWDFLIVLDACRYDYFAKFYKDYLKGNLSRVISVGSSTIEWCRETFQRKYDDVIYVSSNPFVNSRLDVQGFDAKKYFHRVIDVWDWGWNEKLGTVHPKVMNEAVQKLMEEYADKRMIIHYLQPHEPYLACTDVERLFSKPEDPRAWSMVTAFRSVGVDPTTLSSTTLRICNYIAKFLEPKISDNYSILWRVGELLKLPASTSTAVIRRKYGDARLRKAYTENLKIVLKYVSDLVEELPGDNIVVTADHGERLGENNHYSHASGVDDPLLLEVPWFKVEK